MRDLVMVDPATGTQVNYGEICKKRSIGKATVWLTHDADKKLWWIVAQKPGEPIACSGFIEARREVCWETFLDLHEVSLAVMIAGKDYL